MRSENVTNSDGVTFRLYANGSKLFDYHQTNDVWRPFEFDFTPFAARTWSCASRWTPVRANDPSFDYSLWGDRQLVLEGYTPPSSAGLRRPRSCYPTCGQDNRATWRRKAGSPARRP